jgi:hypothetical protein
MPAGTSPVAPSKNVVQSSLSGSFDVLVSVSLAWFTFTVASVMRSVSPSMPMSAAPKLLSSRPR